MSHTDTTAKTPIERLLARCQEAAESGALYSERLGRIAEAVVAYNTLTGGPSFLLPRGYADARATFCRFAVRAPFDDAQMASFFECLRDGGAPAVLLGAQDQLRRRLFQVGHRQLATREARMLAILEVLDEYFHDHGGSETALVITEVIGPEDPKSEA